MTNNNMTTYAITIEHARMTQSQRVDNHNNSTTKS
jgi:hypothetical protein